MAVISPDRAKSTRWLLFALYLCMQCSAVGASDVKADGGFGPQFRWVQVRSSDTNCLPQILVPKGLTGRLRCHSIKVPEQHGNKESPMLTLEVAVIEPKQADRGRRPLLYVHGGPGDNAIGELRTFASHPVSDDRRIVLVDQRGGGRSTPWLCRNLSMFKNGAQGIEQASRCADELRASGYTPEAYTPEAIADDLNAVRIALGIPRWSVLGVSHGALVANHLAVRHPETVDAVILDSGIPDDADTADIYGNFPAALNGIFRTCEEDPGCSGNFPSLRQRFTAFLDKLDIESASDPQVPKASNILAALYDFLTLPDVEISLPLLLHDMIENQSTDFPFNVRKTSYFGAGSINPGANLAISCARADMDRLSAGIDRIERTFPYLVSRHPLREIADFCKGWPGTGHSTPPQRSQATIAVSSSIPALVIHGAADPISPPSYGERLRATWIGPVVSLVVPRAGHETVLVTDCGIDAALAFLNDPAGFEPPASCQDPGPSAFIRPDRGGAMTYRQRAPSTQRILVCSQWVKC